MSPFHLGNRQRSKAKAPEKKKKTPHLVGGKKKTWVMVTTLMKVRCGGG
jgi:hypothetical protein